MATYALELYNSQNATQTFVADITHIAGSFNYSVPMNNFEELSFTMQLEGWKSYCQRIGIDPYLSIQPYTAEIKVKRDGVYLPFVCEIKSAPKKFDTNSSTIEIQARGTLSKLGDALVTKQYVDIDATEITRDLITLRQAKTYGDFGITFGNTYLTGVPSSRTYERYTIMEAIRNLSDDASGGFDFYFDHDWKYYTMAQRGSLKNNVTFRFGGDASNVLSYSNPEDGTSIANDMIIVGEGIGNPITATATDVTSALTFGLREGSLVFSEIDNQDWLNNRALIEVADRKDMYDLPSLVISGEVFDLGTIWVGDTIPVVCTDVTSPYNGSGRIKQLNVAVDENHQEVITVECFKV
jgi:hypothetical protein